MMGRSRKLVAKDVLERNCLKPYEAHGAEFARSRGDEAEGDCPFCGGEAKFHVNTIKEVWHCKTCSGGGRLEHFLSRAAEEYATHLEEDPSLLERLAESRGIPEVAFVDQDMGHDGSSYTIAVRDFEGFVVELSMAGDAAFDAAVDWHRVALLEKPQLEAPDLIQSLQSIAPWPARLAGVDRKLLAGLKVSNVVQDIGERVGEKIRSASRLPSGDHS